MKFVIKNNNTANNYKVYIKVKVDLCNHENTLYRKLSKEILIGNARTLEQAENMIELKLAKELAL